METKFSNFNYEIIFSCVEKRRQVCVSFIYNDKIVKRFIYIPCVKNKNDNYYIDAARKIINQEINNGKLTKYSKSYGKVNNKKVGIIIASIVCAAAIIIAGFFTYRHLKGDNESNYSLREEVKVEKDNL